MVNKLHAHRTNPITQRDLAADASFQVARWRHAADWWSGKIVPSVVDVERAWHAVEQVRYWTERLAVC